MNDYTKDEKKSITSPAAYDSEFNNSSEAISSYMPPPLHMSGEGTGDSSANTSEHNYAQDYERLKNDDINSVHVTYLNLKTSILYPRKQGDFMTYVNSTTGDPWFIAKNGEQSFQPYTQGYRDIVKPKENIEQQKYIEFNSAKLQLSSEGGLVSVDSGGTTTINGDKVAFEFNVASGDFSMSTDLLPLGKISGNIWKKNLGLDAEFEAQLGIISFGKDFSFEIELSIPGLPHSPAIIIGGKLNQPLIEKDMKYLMTRKFFPFIGQILDALETNN